MDAEFVVTDSFHSTVFAIIFNNPFISIGNEGRGLTRFTSLLKKFGLENRLILSLTDFDLKKMESTIDFDDANLILEKERYFAMTFIQKPLKI